MDILLVAATRFEIEPTLLLLEKENNILNGHKIKVLFTGVGSVNTTYFLALALLHKKFNLVIQAGIAGTFQYNLAETVLVKQDAFADIGMETKGNFTTLFDAGFADKNKIPFTDGWLINNNIILNSCLLNSVTAVTVNKVSDSLAQRQQAIQLFAPQIESMEGAAFHFVCLQQDVAFIQIRSISNAVGERDKSKWLIKEAIINLNIELEKLINQL